MALEVHYLGLLFNVDKEPSEEALSNLGRICKNNSINKNFSPNF